MAHSRSLAIRLVPVIRPLGNSALYLNQAGNSNTAMGANALRNNSWGSFNIAVGQGALGNNNASNNTAVGFQALNNNQYGVDNTATGFQALFNNMSDCYHGICISGDENTADGAQALFFNVLGVQNTATGFQALYKNSTALRNTALGCQALFENVSGGENTAVGFQALFRNDGSENVVVGLMAGSNLTTGNNNIDIANGGVAGESNTIRIGTVAQTRTFIAGIRGRTTANANAVPVLIDSTGQLGTTSSSARFKHDIKPMDKTSEAILALKPVTFHYKSDNTNTPQFGLIAEEAAAVNPDLVVRDENGEIYTVRYEAVNAMLLNEFLKEHRKVQEQEKTIAQLKSAAAKQEAKIAGQEKDFQSRLAQQQKAIEALTMGLQKVSAQVEMNRPAPQLVNNNQ
jgi:Chaperone of endosialidase